MNGEPEIVVNVPKKLNTPSETNNATSVKVIRLEGTKTKLEGELRRT